MRLIETGDRTTVHITATPEGRVVTTTTVHHFAECWEHNDRASLTLMMAAHRELLAGTAVCADPEHVADAVAERLAEWEQEAEIEWARTVSHDGWHARMGYSPCDNCTPDERDARNAGVHRIGLPR